MKKILLILVLSVVLLAGCSSKVDIPIESNEISIKNFQFTPSFITVKTGTTITWTNEDSALHTVTSEGNFDSGTLNTGERFTYTFTQAGNFDYICKIHPSMKGKIIVEN